MSDQISSPKSSKRKDPNSSASQSSRSLKAHRKNKKQKGNGGQDASDIQLVAPVATSESIVRTQDGLSTKDTPQSTVTNAMSGSKPTMPMASLSAATKNIARSAVAFGFLPRQISRTTPGRQQITSSSNTSTELSLKATTISNFRAKDIMANNKLLTSSLSQSDRATSVPASTTASISDVIVTSKSTLIKAEPLFVNPDKRANRYEFPYGNYPNYYEKRIQEQTKQANPRSSSSPSILVEHRGLPETVKVWNKTWENQMDQSYHQRKHFRLSATPTVLFPPECIWYTPGSSSKRKNSKGIRKKVIKPIARNVTLVELAKRVDLRLEFLEPSWFRSKRVLDIGCNSALITVFIALHYKPHLIQGVDLDPSLIGKAQKFVLKTFSQLSPESYTQTNLSGLSTSSSISTAEVTHDSENVTKSSKDIPYEEYFPRALQKIYGTLPVPKKTEKTEHLFPHNIELRIADWVTEPEESELKESELWDVIIGFSLTKWIHLHHGDEGLKRFFHKVYRNLASGGVFLVEPQGYATYAKRSKITPEMKKTYSEIKFRPEEFRDYLVNVVGFRDSQHLGQSNGNAKNFNRNIYLFRK